MKKTPPQFLCLGITRSIHGAGSTSVSQFISQKILKLPFCNAGFVRRQMAQKQKYAHAIEDEKGLIEFEKKAVAKNPQIDRNLDKKLLKKISRQACVFGGQNLVRLCKTNKILKPNPSCFFFIVLLTCEEKEAAKRILKRKRQEGIFQGKITKTSIAQQSKTSEERIKTNLKIWKKLYGLSKKDYFNPKAYDLVIETTNISQKQALILILKSLLASREILNLLTTSQQKNIKKFLAES